MKKNFCYFILIALLSYTYIIHASKPVESTCPPAAQYYLKNTENVLSLATITKHFDLEARAYLKKNPLLTLGMFMVYEDFDKPRSFRRCVVVYDSTQALANDDFLQAHLVLGLCNNMMKHKVSHVLCAYFSHPICPECAFIMRSLGYTLSLVVEKSACNRKPFPQDVMYALLPMFKEIEPTLIIGDLEDRFSREIRGYKKQNNAIVAIVGFSTKFPLEQPDYEESVFIRTEKSICTYPHLMVDICIQKQKMQKNLVAVCFSDAICLQCGFLLDYVGYEKTNIICNSKGCSEQPFSQEVVGLLEKISIVVPKMISSDKKSLVEVEAKQKEEHPMGQKIKNVDPKSFVVYDKDKKARNMTFSTQEEELMQDIMQVMKKISEGDVVMLKGFMKQCKEYLPYDQKIMFINFAYNLDQFAIVRYLITQIQKFTEKDAHDIIWNFFVIQKNYDFVEWFVETKKVAISASILKKLRKNKEQDSKRAKKCLVFLQGCKNKKCGKKNTQKNKRGKK